MKKLLILLLVACMSFSMVACGEETTSAETPDTPTTTESESTREQTLDELLSTAVELDGYEIYQEYAENKVKATSEYENTSCMVSGNIDTIETDHIVVSYTNCFKVNVYLPKEEIVELEEGQFVTVVGILENMSSEETMAFSGVTCDFNTGYVSKAIRTITGIYKSSTSTDGTHPQGIYLECLNDSGTYFVELVLTDEQKESLTIGAEVTLDGKMFLNYNIMPYSAPTKLVVTEIK